jgi:hypothetical protein
MSYFFLEAYERVHKNRVEEYERMGTAVDKIVEQTEPGMLIHTQNKVSENDHEVVYRWLEVYEKYEDFGLHLENESVHSHMQKISDGILTGPIEVVVYSDWSEEQKEFCRQIPGIRISFAPLVNGYFR